MVDDNNINLLILKKCLYSVFRDDQISRLEQAVHGVAALELLKLRTFDIILLDIDMPCLNGIETAKYIRQSYKQYEILTANRSIPIIAVTTNDSEDSRKIYYKTGMNDCIRKPVNLSLLEQALYKALTLSSNLA